VTTADLLRQRDAKKRLMRLGWQLHEQSSVAGAEWYWVEATLLGVKHEAHAATYEEALDEALKLASHVQARLDVAKGTEVES
jgi:hypothetical protein